MAIDAPGSSDKQLALEVLRRMPEDVTLKEISEEIAILAAIRRGEAAADEGRVLSHEEVKRRAASWTSP
jgi:predicted transcriptional regulator